MKPLPRLPDQQESNKKKKTNSKGLENNP